MNRRHAKLSDGPAKMAGPPLEMEEKDMDGSLDSVQVRSREDMERLQKMHAGRQLPGRTERVDQAQRELEEALATLTEKLSPVLAPEAARDVLAAVEPDPVTELAAWLSSTAHRLETHVQYVRALVDRVDL